MPGTLHGNYGPFKYDEEKRYVFPMFQRAVPGVGTDFNDAMSAVYTQLRRIIEYGIGSGSPNDGFKVEEASSPSNNFKIKGGDGTLEGSGRLFFSGFSLYLKSDVDFISTSGDIHPRSYQVAEESLTDTSANWTTNELVGRRLVPNIDNPGNTYAVVSNTATVINVTPGSTMVSDGAASDDFYRVNLSTPGSSRTDEIYVDVFLDEVTEIEDPTLIHTHIVPAGPAAYRSQLRQNIWVKEGGTTPTSPFTDADGRVHFYYKVATLARAASDANVTSSMITDNRLKFNPGGGGVIIKELDGTPTINPLNELRVTNNSLTDLGSGVGQLELNNVTVEEVDGVPSVDHINKIIVSNGTMTDLGSGIVQLETGGGTTGVVSFDIDPSADISGVTPPTDGTIGTDIDTRDYQTAQHQGERFDFQVPNDYDSGPIAVWYVYAMSSSSANAIDVRWKAKIVDLSTGTIDDTSYPITSSTTISAPSDTSIVYQEIGEIDEGDFGPGDVIQFYVYRRGDLESPAHPGDWKSIARIAVYTGKIATRVACQDLHTSDDYAAETPTTPGTIGTDIDTEDYSPTADNAQKLVYIIPENWDQTSPAYLYLNYAMSTQESGKKCRIQVEGQIVNIDSGSIDTISNEDIYIYPENITADMPQRRVFLRALSESTLHRGDSVQLVIRRKGSDAVNDTHDGWLRMISASLELGQAPSSGFTTVKITENALNYSGVQVVSGSPSHSGLEYPTFTDVGEGAQSFRKMSGTIAGDRMDMSFEGRVQSDQTKIDWIKISMKSSTPLTQVLKVYKKGDSSPIRTVSVSVTTTTATYTISDVDLSSQPGAGDRFWLVVEATLGVSEDLYVSIPYSKQE